MDGRVDGPPPGGWREQRAFVVRGPVRAERQPFAAFDELLAAVEDGDPSLRGVEFDPMAVGEGLEERGA
ncbi:hypothetical protein, partial [Kitasatospora sp. NPDC059571]|uniref:hypothetical protein n=1 Tax=Kitasatospora sp. NPDC059571 TaxID=3346871 RepID=UPI003673CD57